MAKVNRGAAAETPVARPATRRGEARHTALLAAAREVFLEKGFAGSSVEDVVARVGGSKASLYSYFGSKEGLFGAIINAACDQFLADLAVPTALEEDVDNALTAFGRRALKRMLDPQRIRIMRTLIAESVRFPGYSQRLYEAGPQRLLDQLAGYLRLAHAAGRIRCPEPDIGAVQFMELVKGHAQYRALLDLPPFPPGFGLERTLAAAVRTFMAAHAPVAKAAA